MAFMKKASRLLCSICKFGGLRNYDSIARSQQYILFEISLNDGVIIDNVLRHLTPVPSHHTNVAAVGENTEPARAREKLEQGLVAAQRKRAWFSHLSNQKDL